MKEYMYMYMYIYIYIYIYILYNAIILVISAYQCFLL